MADSDLLARVFSLTSGVWTIAGLLFLFLLRVWTSVPAIMEKWIEWRKVKAAEKASDWTRLRDEIVRLSNMLHGERNEASDFRREQLAENERCREELASALTRIAVLEGYEQGRGEARQEVAVLSSAARLIEEKERP